MKNPYSDQNRVLQGCFEPEESKSVKITGRFYPQRIFIPPANEHQNIVRRDVNRQLLRHKGIPSESNSVSGTYPQWWRGSRDQGCFQLQAEQATAVRINPGDLYLSGKGKPLPFNILEKMEDILDEDLSAVRIHYVVQGYTIRAKAFTVGDNIYFAPGKYMPHLKNGIQLLGHELAHVLQQRDGRVINPFGSGIAIIRDPDLDEEAREMENAVINRMYPTRTKFSVSILPSISAEFNKIPDPLPDSESLKRLLQYSKKKEIKKKVKKEKKRSIRINTFFSDYPEVLKKIFEIYIIPGEANESSVYVYFDKRLEEKFEVDKNRLLGIAPHDEFSTFIKNGQITRKDGEVWLLNDLRIFLKDKLVIWRGVGKKKGKSFKENILLKKSSGFTLLESKSDWKVKKSKFEKKLKKIPRKPSSIDIHFVNNTGACDHCKKRLENFKMWIVKNKPNNMNFSIYYHYTSIKSQTKGIEIKESELNLLNGWKKSDKLFRIETYYKTESVKKNFYTKVKFWTKII